MILLLTFFVTISDGITIRIQDNQPRPAWPKCYFLKSEIYPGKRYHFGSLLLNGPNNPLRYLNTCYGVDWKNTGYQGYDHLNMKPRRKVKFLLTEMKMRNNETFGVI